MKNRFLKMITATVLVSAVAILGVSYYNVNVNTTTAYADEYDDEETPLDRILYGQGSVSDYASIGVSGVTETNLEDVNNYVYYNDCETKAQAKTYASKMVTALKTINAGTTALSYYETIGIDTEDVTSDYTPFIKSAVLSAKSEKGDNLTADEIRDAFYEGIDTLDTIMSDISSGCAEIEEYQALGMTNVTPLLLEDVNMYESYHDCETIAQIKNNAETLINALKTINAGTTALSYYETVGIDTEDVTSDYTPFIKSAVLAAKSEKGDNLTADEIRDAFYEGIDTLDTIMSDISSGCAEIEEYQALGMTNVTPLLLEDVNMYESYHDCETIAQIKNNAATLIKALKAVNAGTTVISNYEKLEIYDVNKSNAGAVKKAILKKKKAMGRNLTISEIEDVIYDLDL